MGGAASSTRQFCTANRHRTTRLTWPGAPVRASLWLPIVGTLVAPEAVARETCRSGRMLSLPPPMGGHASRPAPWLPREAVVAPPQIGGHATTNTRHPPRRGVVAPPQSGGHSSCFHANTAAAGSVTLTRAITVVASLLMRWNHNWPGLTCQRTNVGAVHCTPGPPFNVLPVPACAR